MILIGQYDSPFVRRVGIALTLYGQPFEHRPWSTFGDADRLRALNPLTRVPTMVLDDGSVLIDSFSILDHIDSLVAPAARMMPAEGPARRDVQRVVALATGLSDKAVALFYELRLHETPSQIWSDRCRTQIGAALAALETDRAGRSTDFWCGAAVSHADIAVACALRHMRDSHPGLFAEEAFPALAAHGRRMEAMAVFQSVSQPFVAPA